MREHFSEPIEIVFNDDTLDLSDVQPFSRQYTLQTGAEVRIVHRWAGPASGGPEWGPIEVAVVVVLAYDVINMVTHVSVLVRDFLIKTYHQIKPESGARIYTSGVLGVAVENEDRSFRLTFCLPMGLTPEEVRDQMDLIQRDAPGLLARWEAVPPNAPFMVLPGEMRIRWDYQEGRWSPTPEEQQAEYERWNGTPDQP